MHTPPHPHPFPPQISPLLQPHFKQEKIDNLIPLSQILKQNIGYSEPIDDLFFSPAKRNQVFLKKQQYSEDLSPWSTTAYEFDKAVLPLNQFYNPLNHSNQNKVKNISKTEQSEQKVHPSNLLTSLKLVSQTEDFTTNNNQNNYNDNSWYLHNDQFQRWNQKSKRIGRSLGLDESIFKKYRGGEDETEGLSSSYLNNSNHNNNHQHQKSQKKVEALKRKDFSASFDKRDELDNYIAEKKKLHILQILKNAENISFDENKKTTAFFQSRHGRNKNTGEITNSKEISKKVMENLFHLLPATRRSSECAKKLQQKFNLGQSKVCTTTPINKSQSPSPPSKRVGATKLKYFQKKPIKAIVLEPLKGEIKPLSLKNPSNIILSKSYQKQQSK